MRTGRDILVIEWQKGQRDVIIKSVLTAGYWIDR